MPTFGFIERYMAALWSSTPAFRLQSTSIIALKKTIQLQNYGIIPILVFDGGYLPMKSATEMARRE